MIPTAQPPAANATLVASLATLSIAPTIASGAVILIALLRRLHSRPRKYTN